MSNKVSLTYTNASATAQNVSTGTPLPVMPPDVVTGNNTTLTNGTVVNGLFSSGTVTNPTASQVILGPIDTLGANSFAFQMFSVSGTIPALTFQTSDLLAGPYTTVFVQASSNNQGPIGTVAVANNGIYEGPVKHRYIQVISSAATGVFSLQGYLRSTSFVSMYSTQAIYGQVVTATPASISAGGYVSPALTSSKYAISTLYTTPELSWSFSTAGTPITTATSTVLNAAGAAGVRNYIDGIQLYNTGAAGTEIQILDGATVIWNGFLGAAASLNPGKIEIGQLGIPLRGTAATNISLKTVSGTTISITGSVQGYQAT